MIKTIEELYKFLDNCIFGAVVENCVVSCKLSLRTVKFEDYFSKPFSEIVDIISVKYYHQLAVDRSFGYFDIFLVLVFMEDVFIIQTQRYYTKEVFSSLIINIENHYLRSCVELEMRNLIIYCVI